MLRFVPEAAHNRRESSRPARRDWNRFSLLNEFVIHSIEPKGNILSGLYSLVHLRYENGMKIQKAVRVNGWWKTSVFRSVITALSELGQLHASLLAKGKDRTQEDEASYYLLNAQMQNVGVTDLPGLPKREV